MAGKRMVVRCRCRCRCQVVVSVKDCCRYPAAVMAAPAARCHCHHHCLAGALVPDWASVLVPVPDWAAGHYPAAASALVAA